MPLITTRVTAAQEATVKGLPLTNAEIDTNFINLNNAIILSGDLTGFPDRTASELTFEASTRTVSLAPVDDVPYDVYYKGKPITISTTLTLVIDNIEGPHYIVLDPNTGALSDVGTNFSISDVILVAHVYWEAGTSNAIIFADERHSSSVDKTWHQAQHSNVGAVWRSGGDISYVLNNSSLPFISLTNLLLADEDLLHAIVHADEPNGYYQQDLLNAQIPVIYQLGTTQVQTPAAAIPWVAGTTTARYNQMVGNNGSLIDAGEGTYINYWIVATNDMKYPIKAIMGRAAHTSIMNAKDEVLQPSDLPFEELAIMYQVTLRTSTTYTGNVSRVVIANVRRMATLSDGSLRSKINGLTHAGLALTSSDDHLQYIHIANSRTISAAHTFNGVQTFTNGIKINSKPTVGLDGANKNYVDQQALLMAFLNA